MKYKLVIFDLDGTILNTLEDLADSVNHVLAQYGYPLHTLEEIRSFVGNGIRRLIERSVPADTDSTVIDSIHADFTTYYKANCAVKTRPYDGISALLTQLRKAGCLTAVVSNKADFGVKTLCDQYFPEQFDIALGERAGIPRKPAPDAVHEVLTQLGIGAADAVYIGDSDVDIATARNAGLDCVCVDWGFRDHAFLQANGAPVILSDAHALAAHLLD